MITKYLALGIGLCACTYFVSESAERPRKIAFQNQSDQTFTLYHPDNLGLNSHTILNKQSVDLYLRPSEDVVVKWNSASIQKKILINPNCNTVTMFSAVMMRLKGQEEFLLFPDPDKQKLQAVPVPSQSSSSSSEDED